MALSLNKPWVSHYLIISKTLICNSLTFFVKADGASIFQGFPQKKHAGFANDQTAFLKPSTIAAQNRFSV